MEMKAERPGASTASIRYLPYPPAMLQCKDFTVRTSHDFVPYLFLSLAIKILGFVRVQKQSTTHECRWLQLPRLKLSKVS